MSAKRIRPRAEPYKREFPTLRQRIRDLLADGIPRTAAEIAAHYQLERGNTCSNLNQMVKLGQIYRDVGNERGYHYLYSDHPLEKTEPSTTRFCEACGQTKALTHEHWYSQKRAGYTVYMATCKACRRASANPGQRPDRDFSASENNHLPRKEPEGRLIEESTVSGRVVHFGKIWKPFREDRKSLAGFTGYSSPLTRIDF